MGGRRQVRRGGALGVFVEHLHMRQAIAGHAHRPGGAHADLCEQARGEHGRAGEARAGLTLAARGDRDIDGEHKGIEACVFSAGQHVGANFRVAGWVELEPAVVA